MKLLQIGNIYVLQKHIKVLLLPDMLKSYIQPIWVCYFPLVFTNVSKARSINIYINGYKTHKQMPFKTNVCGINYWSPSTISLGSMIYKTLSPSSSTVEDIKPTFGHFPLMTGNSFLGKTAHTTALILRQFLFTLCQNCSMKRLPNSPNSCFWNPWPLTPMLPVSSGIFLVAWFQTSWSPSLKCSLAF